MTTEPKTLTREEALAAVRELGRTNIQGMSMPKATTPLEGLQRLFALATFAKHRRTSTRQGRHIKGRALRAMARIAKRKNKRS